MWLFKKKTVEKPNGPTLGDVRILRTNAEEFYIQVYQDVGYNETVYGWESTKWKKNVDGYWARDVSTYMEKGTPFKSLEEAKTAIEDPPKWSAFVKAREQARREKYERVYYPPNWEEQCH